MIERLRSVVGDALVAAGNVSASAQQMAAGSETLSQGATEQAAATEEASSSIEEMAGNIKQNADNAAQTEKIARQSAKDAEVSGVPCARRSMPCRPSRPRSHRQEIARQTDLLALNAAVEAAARANMAAALPWSPAKCASWPNAARKPRPKSARCRPTR
jgi:methyl-accepting chemotaxis protein